LVSLKVVVLAASEAIWLQPPVPVSDRSTM